MKDPQGNVITLEQLYDRLIENPNQKIYAQRAGYTATGAISSTYYIGTKFPLFGSIYSKPELMKALVQHPKLKPNIKDQYGNMLHLAVLLGDSEAIESVLTIKGLDVNQIDDKKQTAPIVVAMYLQDIKSIQPLVDHPDIKVDIPAGAETALHAAAGRVLRKQKRNNFDQYMVLLEKMLRKPNVNVNVVNEDQNTPLHEVGMTKFESKQRDSGILDLKIKAAKLLKKHGADIKLKNKNGLTPRDLFKQNGYPDELLEVVK